VENLELRVRRQYLAGGRIASVARKSVAVLRNILKNTRRVEEGILVFSPFLMPVNRPKFLVQLNVKLLVRSVRRLIQRLGLNDPIIWVYLPSPLVARLLSRLPYRVLVYDCASNFQANPLAEEGFELSEPEIMSRANVIFVDSRGRCAEMESTNPNVVFAPNGVDFSLFDRARTQKTEVPADISSVDRPIVGYTGTLHYWVDCALIEYLAERHPEWSIVLVGPVDALTDTSRIVDKPNVHLLGAKAHGEIPQYVKQFDVAVIPYRVHEFTRYVNPTKLHEYLALGRPVVATRLPELEPFRNLVRIAGNHEEFVQHVEELIGKGSDRDELSRVRVAEQNSWDSIVSRMAREVGRHLPVGGNGGRGRCS
jgi:glycosyltransferase involved in cell wall biosynthesis